MGKILLYLKVLKILHQCLDTSKEIDTILTKISNYRKPENYLEEKMKDF